MKKMNKIYSTLGVFFLFAAAPALAVDGVYLGGQVGAVGLNGGATNTAIGFGVDLGLRANPLVDVIFHFQTSSHSGLTIYAPHLSAEIHYADVNDFDFTIGVGPGLYFFKALNTDTNFGLNFGTAVDFKLDEAIRLGLGARYHLVFSPAVGSGNFWSFMFRAGYFFEW